MGISERRQRQKDEVRQAIMETAWNIVMTQGWHALSMRSIAGAIEYSAPVIYSHFDNKEALLHEFYKQGFLLLGKKLEKARSKYDSPEDRLYAVALGYWDFAFDNKQYYQVMFGVNMECCSGGNNRPPEVENVISIFQSSIEEVLNKNGNKKADPQLKRSTLWSILHGLVSINLTSKILKEKGKTEKVLDDAIQSFIFSLKK